MLTDLRVSKRSKYSTSFSYVDGLSVRGYVLTLTVLLFVLLASWSGPSVISGFGHISFSSFERKISLMIVFMFFLYNLVTVPSFYFINASSYDLIIVFNQLTYWLMFLFFTSNILSLSFVIEVLTALITLMLVTSVSPSYHSGLTSSSTTYNHWLPSLPSTYLNSLLFFFWTSLVTTLFLYLFLILLYTKFLTLEWALVDLVSSYLVLTSTLSELSTLSFSWAFVLTAIFLKCAITPFFFWKPTFFKGISYVALFYYIFVFYFTIFIYFMHFLMGLFSDVFFFNTLFILMILLLGTFIVPAILYESLNVKSFFAISSIMNSLIVLFTTISYSSVTQVFFL